VGDPAFGAQGFRYCGSIMAPASDPQFARGPELLVGATELARIVAGEFGLIGVNGIDFIAADGVPYAIEVNPRWSASMELAERQFGTYVFALHASACDGVLADFNLTRALSGCGAAGKAIVFARHDAIAPDTDRWLDCGWVRDVPHSGERFEAGWPVCTVFAEGSTADECYHRLAERAAGIAASLVQSA
jgi:predicted ATP-grasp superfamily ATP-dependent carboligase